MNEDDHGFHDLLKQLDSAMDRLELGDPKTRDLIGKGVKEALRGLFPDVKPEASAPDVVVLDGGRSDDDPPASDTERPPLEVATPPDADDDWDEVPRVSVRVVTLGAEDVDETVLDGHGSWSVDEALPQQLIYAGPSAACYRLRCGRGRIEVLASGTPLTTLVPGRTVDVESTQLEVRGSGAGTYERLLSV